MKKTKLVLLLTCVLLLSQCKKTEDTDTETRPVASFEVQNNNCIEPCNVTFNNTSTGANVYYTWDFGDGQYSHEISPAHNYVAAGTYTVILTVENSKGSSNISKVVTVRTFVSSITKCVIKSVSITGYTGSFYLDLGPSPEDQVDFNFSVINSLGQAFSTSGGIQSNVGPNDIPYYMLPAYGINMTDFSSTYTMKIFDQDHTNLEPNDYAPISDFTFKPSDYLPSSGAESQTTFSDSVITVVVVFTWS